MDNISKRFVESATVCKSENKTKSFPCPAVYQKMKRKKIFWLLLPFIIFFYMGFTGILLLILETSQNQKRQHMEEDLRKKATLLSNRLNRIPRKNWNDLIEQESTLLEMNIVVSSHDEKISSAYVKQKNIPFISVSVEKNFTLTLKRPLSMKDLLPGWKISLLFLLFFSFTTTFLIAKIVKTPLYFLRKAMNGYVRGDFSHKLISGHSFEFKQLSDSLLSMRDKLKKTVEKNDNREKDWKVFFSSMLEGLATFDRHGCLTLINKAAVKQHLLNEKEDFTGRPIVEVFRHPVIEELSLAILKGGKALEEEIQLTNSNIIQVSASSLRDGGDAIQGGLLVFRNITRIRELENHHREFVANVSHELRTPLTSIQGFIETLLGNTSSEHAPRFLKIIQRHTKRLRAIVEDLLTLAQLERKNAREQLNFQRLDIESIIVSAIQTCEHESRKKDIRIKFEKDHITEYYEGRDLLLEQALINLIDNAIKYSDSGMDIMIRCKEQDDLLLISITDQGGGIPFDHLPRLFERFYVVDKSRDIRRGGTGLGLSIVKRIIDLHEGNISIESSLGKGSIFTISLPGRNHSHQKP